MTSSYLNVILPFLTDCGILQFTPSLRYEITLQLLYKLLPKTLTVITFHVCNSAILFYFILCVYVVHIVFSCNFHELYLYLCFIAY